VTAATFEVHALALEVPGVPLGDYEPLPLTAKP
jgi:hypothetical protein